MIQFTGISKAYDDVLVLDDINLDIRDGEFVVLLGPSGSGKTTLLKLINRLHDPSQGSITIDGRDIRDIDMRQLRLNTGYVLQKVGLFPNLTVGENIQIVPELKKVSREERVARAKELLDKVGMPASQYWSRFPHELSGGEQQRIGILRAVIGNPQFLLMDEPFSALDVVTRHQLQDLIRQLHDECDMTTVFVTHDSEEALRLADRLVIMKHGKIELDGTPDEVMSHVNNEFVRGLAGLQ